jgi:hypothetical protein
MKKAYLLILSISLVTTSAFAQRTILIKNDSMMSFEVFGGGYKKLQPNQEMPINYSNPQYLALERNLSCRTSYEWKTSCGVTTWEGYQPQVKINTRCKEIENNQYVIRLSCGN